MNREQAIRKDSSARLTGKYTGFALGSSGSEQLMRLVIFGMCVLVAAGVFVTMFLAIWRARGARAVGDRFYQSAIREIVWAAIPCLMIIAAANPAAMAIIASRAAN